MNRTIIILFIVVLSNFPTLAQDTTFVHQSELELNWGLWTVEGQNGPEFPILNSKIEHFQVSQNGRYLAYYGYTINAKGNKFHVYDLKNETEIFSYPYRFLGHANFWFLDSINLLFIDATYPDSNGRFTYYLTKVNLELFEIDSLPGGNGKDNCFFGSIGADRKGYVTEISKGEYKRLMIDSSYKVGYPVQEEIPNYSDMGNIGGRIEPYIPLFPPCNCEYGITHIYTRDNNGSLKRKGFSVVTNFDYQNNRQDHLYSSIQLSDSNWVRDEGYICSLGKKGDIYLRFGYTSKKEIDRGFPYENDKNPFDSVMLAARSTWGYYRIDTSGNNLVQLVRSWNRGNLQVTCDGSIYYYMINLQDTTSAIWKMNKYGKNKQMVFNLKKPVSVNERKESNIFIYPNPTENVISLKNIPDGAVSFEIYDIFGKNAVPVEAIHELPLQIDVSRLQPGIYFLKFNNQAKPIKFVKL